MSKRISRDVWEERLLPATLHNACIPCSESFEDSLEDLHNSRMNIRIQKIDSLIAPVIYKGRRCSVDYSLEDCAYEIFSSFRLEKSQTTKDPELKYNTRLL